MLITPAQAESAGMTYEEAVAKAGIVGQFSAGKTTDKSPTTTRL